jgi:hypothetical protein
MGDLIAGAVSDDESTFGGAAVFDAMTRSQQLASLETVSQNLFHRTEKCLELTAWSEATLASILNEVRTFVLTETDESETSECRDTVAAALGGDAEIDDYDSTEEWESVLEAYEDRFLWDLDYEDNVVGDLPPEHASMIRNLMAISDDYYSAVPPDLKYEEDVRHSYRRLLMAIDGRKTIRMTATLTCEVPASFRIQNSEQAGQTLDEFFPAIILMRHAGGGDASQVSDEQEAFFLDGSEFDHTIEEL